MADELALFDKITNKVKYNDFLVPFGKYQGEFVADVLYNDRPYFDWLYTVADGELKKAMDFHKENNNE